MLIVCPITKWERISKLGCAGQFFLLGYREYKLWMFLASCILSFRFC